MTGGFSGALPQWYGLIRAARYLGVAPWELAEKPAIWRDWAVAAESAEVEAQKRRMKTRARA